LIIGTKGVVINGIRDKYGVDIDLPPKEETAGKSPDQLVSMRVAVKRGGGDSMLGSEQSRVQQALEEIRSMCAARVEREQRDQQRDQQRQQQQQQRQQLQQQQALTRVVMRTQITRRYIGLIIGKQGVNIDRMRRQHGVEIRLPPRSNGSSGSSGSGSMDEVVDVTVEADGTMAPSLPKDGRAGAVETPQVRVQRAVDEICQLCAIRPGNNGRHSGYGGQNGAAPAHAHGGGGGDTSAAGFWDGGGGGVGGGVGGAEVEMSDF
jgi:predicted PilT family ATPase